MARGMGHGPHGEPPHYGGYGEPMHHHGPHGEPPHYGGYGEPMHHHGPHGEPPHYGGYGEPMHHHGPYGEPPHHGCRREFHRRPPYDLYLSDMYYERMHYEQIRKVLYDISMGRPIRYDEEDLINRAFGRRLAMHEINELLMWIEDELRYF